jgi:hypothetical protein
MAMVEGEGQSEAAVECWRSASGEDCGWVEEFFDGEWQRWATGVVLMNGRKGAPVLGQAILVKTPIGSKGMKMDSSG